MPLRGKRRSNMRRAAARTFGVGATMVLSAGSPCRSCCYTATAIPSPATPSAFIQFHTNGLRRDAVRPTAMLGITPTGTTRPPPSVGSSSILLGGTSVSHGSSKGQRRHGDRAGSEGGVSLHATSILLNGEPVSNVSAEVTRSEPLWSVYSTVDNTPAVVNLYQTICRVLGKRSTHLRSGCSQ